MMGTRHKLSGLEWDAFSRRSRKLMRWRTGEVAAIKSAFRRRLRHRLKQSLNAEAAQ